MILLKDEIKAWFEALVAVLPGRLGIKVRRIFWQGRFKSCGSFTLASHCQITSPESISLGSEVTILEGSKLHAHAGGKIGIGSRVCINSNVLMGASENGEIHLGNDVLIGPNVVLRASNHAYERKDLPINRQGHTGGKIVIEDDVWIGANAVILPDVTIGRGSVIGAGAVVNQSIPPNCLAVGVPARVKKENLRR